MSSLTWCAPTLLTQIPSAPVPATASAIGALEAVHRAVARRILMLPDHLHVAAAAAQHDRRVEAVRGFDLVIEVLDGLVVRVGRGGVVLARHKDSHRVGLGHKSSLRSQDRAVTRLPAHLRV